MLLVKLVVSCLNLLGVKALECVSVVNQKCMSRPKIINTNANEPVLYPLSVKVNKCSGDCNNINDPMAKLCVPDVVRVMNINVFNLLSRINETRKVVCHETCKCICRLTSAVCNERQERNKNKYVCQCKEDLVGKLVCDKGYTWNPSTCACECDKFCEVGQYLDYENCAWRKKIVGELIEQCTSIVDLEIKNGYGILPKESSISSSDVGSNVYLFLLAVLLIVCILLAVGFVYYCRRANSKKVDAKIYNVAYSNAGTLN